ncbi:NAD(P)-dependent oxidoreductase [Streptomyces sp. 8L]|uniref:NAD(P)-dependent oxidoreductase n=1 Tax=Streptomyces sp. 8L TaxID=2877242 RepID=UPI001CD3C0C5|nr:NAD(P)-dependent oxidoreductase [Streptomyces sp. 8L]MCA1220496.1 NAD(P)-dependent oxidoreductase [Streptomyces sp. 8L]
MVDHKNVALLGTGIMGAAMARNLLRTGHGLRVWNRTRAKAEPLAADGAQVFDTAAEAVTGADVVITMLFDGPATLETMRDAAPGFGRGAVWLQSTTVGVDDVPRLAAFGAEHGLVFVDGPVLGTKAPAEAGKLTTLAAGPQEAREALASVFDAIGARTVWAGDDGASAAATRLKLVCNNWTLALTHGAVESVALAKGLGVDPTAFLDTIKGGLMDCGYVHLKSEMIMNGDFTPSFALTNAAKDARLIVAAADAAGVRMDVTEAGIERFRRAEADGHGDEDMAAAYFASFDD